MPKRVDDMMNERALFDAALELEDPAKRQAFVEKACAGDHELLRKVTSLLEAHNQANSFLENPALNFKPQDLNKPAQASHIEETSDFSIGQSDKADEAFAKVDIRNDESDDSDEEKVDLSFLKPSTKTGSIGSLGHYEILQVLGQGGFGVVFKAFDEKLHRLVAIKVMNPQMAATSPPRKRFLREARAVAAIKNENVVQVYSVEEQPLPYMVMEFIDGQTLQEKLDGNGPLDVNEVLYLGRQMANALASAHALGIIHRDIKPGNILLEQGVEQKVKITDFGLARAADDASMTRTGLISGTPLYMSPEQALGQQLDQRSDLFSLGSVLYQMACGRAPFRAPTAIAVLRRVADETPRPIQQILPELPDWLAALIVKLHAKKPDERFQSAKELADLLARYQSEIQLHGKVTLFKKQEPAEALAEISKDNAPQVALATQTQPTKKKTNKTLVGAIAALVSVAVLSPFCIPRNRLQDVAPKQDSPTISSNTTATGWQGWPADAPLPAIAPFNAEQAKQHQEAWAKYLNVPVEYTNSIGMKFRLIPPGEFLMGAPQTDIDALVATNDPQNKVWEDVLRSQGPQHRVILTQPFYAGIHEVTREQFQRVMGERNKTTQSEKAPDTNETKDSNHPERTATWGDAIKFTVQLSQLEQLPASYLGADVNWIPQEGSGYRLPTEAQWEFAGRAGTTTRYWSGPIREHLLAVDWVGENSENRTHAVGEKPANPFGLFDIHGNAIEWTENEFDPTDYQKFRETSAIDPRRLENPGWTTFVARGGASDQWGDLAFSSAFRLPRGFGNPPTESGIGGCRLVLSVEAVRTLSKLTGPQVAARSAASHASSPVSSD